MRVVDVVCYNRDLVPVKNQKLEAGVSEVLAEVNCWLGCILECGSVMCLFQSRVRQYPKAEASSRNQLQELAEVNRWLLCLLKCRLVFFCVTWPVSEVIS